MIENYLGMATGRVKLVTHLNPFKLQVGLVVVFSSSSRYRFVDSDMVKFKVRLGFSFLGPFIISLNVYNDFLLFIYFFGMVTFITKILYTKHLQLSW